jgi:PAS domain S-box-containing protein
LIYFVLSRRISQPLESIERTVRSVGRLDYAHSAPVFYNDELGRVAQSINKMIGELSSTTVSKAYVESILGSMRDMLFVLERDGTIKTINEAVTRQLGYAKTDLYGRNAASIFSGALAPVQLDHASEFEASISKRGGATISVAVSSAPIVDQKGGTQKFMLIARDITEKKKVEGELERARFQSVSSAKMASLGEMAGGIAHEINTPLAIVITIAGQMQELIADEELNRALLKEMTGKIEATSQRIAKIVKGMRVLSRDGRNDDYTYTSVESIVSDTLALCSEKFKLHGVQLILDPIPQGLGLECRASELSQVILNLLNNAYDAVEKLDQKWVRLSVNDKAAHMEIFITDSGNGLPPGVQKKLFQPFFTTKEVGKGTGLGLGISKTIAENHGGSLSIDLDCPNTRFVISLAKVQKKKQTA